MTTSTEALGARENTECKSLHNLTVYADSTHRFAASLPKQHSVQLELQALLDTTLVSDYI
jgi:hypothetical protein